MTSEDVIYRNIAYYEDLIANAKKGDIDKMFCNYVLPCAFEDLHDFIVDLEELKKKVMRYHGSALIHSDEDMVTIEGRPPHSQSFIDKFVSEKTEELNREKSRLKKHKDKRYEQYLKLKQEFDHDENQTKKRT